MLNPQQHYNLVIDNVEPLKKNHDNVEPSYADNLAVKGTEHSCFENHTQKGMENHTQKGISHQVAKDYKKYVLEHESSTKIVVVTTLHQLTC